MPRVSGAILDGRPAPSEDVRPSLQPRPASGSLEPWCSQCWPGAVGLEGEPRLSQAEPESTRSASFSGLLG